MTLSRLSSFFFLLFVVCCFPLFVLSAKKQVESPNLRKGIPFLHEIPEMKSPQVFHHKGIMYVYNTKLYPSNTRPYVWRLKRDTTGDVKADKIDLAPKDANKAYNCYVDEVTFTVDLDSNKIINWSLPHEESGLPDPAIELWSSLHDSLLHVLRPYHKHRFSSEVCGDSLQYAFLLPKVNSKKQLVPDCWVLIILTYATNEWSESHKKYLENLILPFLPLNEGVTWKKFTASVLQHKYIVRLMIILFVGLFCYLLFSVFSATTTSSEKATLTMAPQKTKPSKRTHFKSKSKSKRITTARSKVSVHPGGLT